MEALGIPEGASVTVEVREARVIVEPVIPADLREAAERALEKTRRGLEYLA
jgi:antitoxin component of MazEF toxin-antitoxin module